MANALEAAADPYAAIRTLGADAFRMGEGQWGENEAGRYLISQGGLTYGEGLSPLLQQTGFESKYNRVTDLGDGRVMVRMQQPGGHKYDTMDVVYQQGPDGRWVMQGAPQMTREVSSLQYNLHDNVDAIAPLVAMYAGGQLAQAAGAGGSVAGAGEAGWAAGGGYGAGAADVGMAAAGGGGAAASGGAASAGGGTGAAGGSAGVGGGAMSNWDWLGGVAEQVIPALIQDRAARGAREDMNAATQAGIAEQRRQFDQTRADLAPYRDAVSWSMPQLQGLIGQPVSPEEVMQDPGYQFGLDQSMRALNQRIAAMGGRVSGNALRGAAEYAGNYATTRYNDAHARRMDRIRALQSMAGLSQNAASQTGQFGAGAANAITGMLGQQGEADAGSRMARGNIWANAGNALMAQYGRRPPPQQRYSPYDMPGGNPDTYGPDDTGPY